MRQTILATAASTLAAAALVAGAGTAAAEESEEPEQDDAPVCVRIETYTGYRTMCLTPAEVDTLGSFGYGSAGTGSLMDLITGVINFGSTTLSVDVPNSVGSTGFYAPGSFGSYGPMAPVGEVLTASVGIIGGSF